MGLREDYALMFSKLMPPGQAFEGDGVKKLLGGIAKEFTRVHVRSEKFLIEELPDRLNALIPDWERVLGLDNRDLGSSERSALIRKKLASPIGQSRDDYQNLIGEFTDNPVIKDFTPYTCGMPIGQRIYGIHWNFVWEVENIPEEKIEQIKRAVLPLTQAHTIVQFKTNEGIHV